MFSKTQLQYLEDKKRGFLATCGKKHRPRIVPVCFSYTKEKIYIPIDKKPKKTYLLARVDDIKENQNVAFIVDYYSDDWSKLSYMLVFGIAEIIQDGDEMLMASYLLNKRYPQYSEIGSEFYFMISLSPTKVKEWSFVGGSRVKKNIL